MKIVCSWCRREGKVEFVGEKAPLDDARETHGICSVHRHAVEARWRTSTGWSFLLFRWTGLLNTSKKARQ